MITPVQRDPLTDERLLGEAEGWDEYVKRPKPVRAVQMDRRFAIKRKGVSVSLRGNEGDYIILDSEGQFFVCEPEVFEASYVSREDLESRKRRARKEAA